MLRNSHLISRRRNGAYCALVAAALVLLAPASPAGTQSIRPEKVVLALKWYHQFQFAGYYAAQARGFYAAEGLEVDFREPAMQRPPVETVAKGEADYGVAGTDLLLARSRGAPVVVLAAVFQHSPVVILSRADRNLRTPADLVGKKVMVEENTSAEFKAMLLHEGIPLKAVLTVPHSWRVDDILSGNVDASVDYLIDEPHQLKQRGTEPAVMRPIDYGIDFYGDCLFTSERELREHPERAAAFRRASLRGWEYAFEHVEELIPLILALPGVQARGITAEHLRYEADQMRILVQPDLVEIGHMNPGRWRRIAEVYKELGLIPAAFTLDRFLSSLPNGGGSLRWGLFLVAGVLAGVVGVGAIAGFWSRQLRRSVKNTTRELRESREYLQSILDASHDAIFVHEVDAPRILDVNRRMCEMLGCTREQVLQGTIGDFSEGRPPYSQTDAMAWFERARRDGPQTLEWRARRANGEGFWAEISVRVAVIGGQERGVVVVRDITERKRAEEELRESAERFQTLIDTVPDLAIHGYTMDGTAIYWNAACERLYGYAAAEAVGQQMLERIVPPELRAAVRDNIKAMELGVSSISPAELVLHRKDGTRVHVYSGYAVLRRPGRPPQFFCMDIDLTERLAGEQALRESEERFRILIDTVPDLAIQGYLMDGTVSYWNKASERLYGYSSAEAMGRNLCDLIIPDEMQTEVRGAIRTMAETGKAIPAGELSLRRKDGSRVAIYSGHAVIQAPGQPDHFFCMDIDLADRKKAEADKARLQDQLAQAQKMESIGRLAGGVAHDFNNMLGVITGYAELALAQVDPADQLHGDLEEILKAARRSTDLTRQLLAYARKQPVTPRVLDLNDRVANSLNLLRRLIGEGPDLRWQPGEHLWPVKVDPVQVDQILTNLCTNARDAVGGAGAITIQTGNRPAGRPLPNPPPGWVEGDYTWLSVADSGHGMDKDMLAHIFEPFFTTKVVGRGTGLGLATIYGIVKQNDGYIDVQSQPGQGTVFTVYLPRHAGPLDDEESEAAAPAPAAAGQTILLVEDELAMLQLCQSSLERQGFRVLATATPADALRIAAEQATPFDLLVTDVVMPGMNGWELAQRLQERQPGLRVLFITGYTPDAILQQGIALEPDLVLQKPFAQTALVARVQALLAEA